MKGKQQTARQTLPLTGILCDREESLFTCPWLVNVTLLSFFCQRDSRFSAELLSATAPSPSYCKSACPGIWQGRGWKKPLITIVLVTLSSKETNVLTERSAFL